MDNKTALITGATSGIGAATARVLADHGMPIIICGRRPDRLRELKEELEKKTKVCALQFDVGDKKAVFKAIESIPKAFGPIRFLINNAGNAHGLDPVQDGDIADWDAMINSNIKGLLYVTKAVIPQLKAHKSGHIINIGSLAGKGGLSQGQRVLCHKTCRSCRNRGHANRPQSAWNKGKLGKSRFNGNGIFQSSF